MSDFTYPFDEELARQAGVPSWVNRERFPQIRVLDPEKFAEVRGHEPSIASVFVVTQGGSVHNGECGDTYNGTLCGVSSARYMELWRAKQAEQAR